MKYRVIIEPRAEADAWEQYQWIAEVHGEPLNAQRWYEGLEAAIRTLDRMALRCPVAPESSILGREIRHLLYESHRILYTVNGGLVAVLHVRHCARRLAVPGEL